MSAICLDAGTTMVKAVCFDDDGRPLAVARQTTTVLTGDGGRSEQDMESVWNAAAKTIAEVAVSAAEPLRFLALTGQGDGCWLVDRSGEPTGAAILWNDARAADIVERWAAAGLLDRAFPINGRTAFPGTASAILAWLRAYEPDRLDNSGWVLSCDGWLFHRLTGEIVADQSDACSTFLDVGEQTYSDPLIDLLDMAWAREFLPPIVGEVERIAALEATAAARLGLTSGLPVVLAPFDIPATALGIGAIDPGDAYTILGTTLSTGTILADPGLDRAKVGMTLPAGVPGTYVRTAASMAGTGVLGWLTATLGTTDPATLAAMAATVPAGADGLIMHPYLSPAGERAPIRTPHARGSLVGLCFDHTPAHLARAAFEGLSYVIRDCLDAAPQPVTELRLCGGGAASRLWCQLLADVTGVPTTRSDEDEIGAKGAFITGTVAIGSADDVATAVRRSVGTGDTFVPQASAVARYDDCFAEYIALRTAIAPRWPSLPSLRGPVDVLTP